MLKITICAFLLLLSGHTQAYDFQNIADKHILPVYQELLEQTSALDKSVQQRCDKDSLQEKSKTAFIAWQGAQHIRFGPVQFLSREHRFAFWPDKRGVVGKQLNKLMQDVKLVEDDFDLTQKSVALQGFSVLERLLYSGDDLNNKDCILIRAITNNLTNMSKGIVEDWVAGNDPYLQYFSNPNAKNLIFKNEAELASQILNSLFTQLELVIKQKIGLPLGDNIEKARSKSAEAWRSESALQAIHANLSASHELYRCVFYSELVDDPLQREIEASFQDAFLFLEKIEIPLAEAVKNIEQRGRVEALRAQVSDIKNLITRDMASKLELSVGFNSLDGD
ncbi:MAG: imelysin family protein [Gammaproteobacteria bacterium]